MCRFFWWLVCGYSFPFFWVNTKESNFWFGKKKRYPEFFKKTSDCLPKCLYHFTFSPIVNVRFSHSTSLLAFLLSVLSFFCHSNKCVVVFHSSFNLIFPMTFETSHMLICHLYIIFSEVSVMLFSPIFNFFG